MKNLALTLNTGLLNMSIDKTIFQKKNCSINNKTMKNKFLDILQALTRQERYQRNVFSVSCIALPCDACI